jgi:antitoxin YefM
VWTRGAYLYRTLYTLGVAKTVSFTEARARLTELLDEVNERHEHIVITRNGRPAGVVLSSDEYEALTETLGVLEDEEAMDALRESEADVRAGRVYALEEVRRELGLA